MENNSKIFSYFPTKAFVVILYENYLSETVQMRGHNICFDSKMWKIISRLYPLSSLIRVQFSI